MKERKKIENTIGMFDMLKGVAMIFMVFAHNASPFPNLIFDKAGAESAFSAIKFMSYVYDISILPRILFSLVILPAVAMMPALLVVGGYGFRKRPVSKSFKAHFKEMIKPYIITVLATTFCNIFFHYAFFRYLPGALKESLKVFAGLAMGVSQTVEICGHTIYANGPVWFILAMFWSLLIFNVIMNYAKEKHIPYIVFAISVVGWLISYLKFTPWCLSQGLIGVLYAYMGYRLKKNKFFSREFTVKDKILAVTLVFIPNLLFVSFGLITEMADNIYSLGPVSYIENGLMGIFLLYLFLRMNSLNGPISDGFRKVGRYSLYFMCVHTVEMIAVPWYKVAEIFGEKQMAGFCVLFVARVALILFIVFLITKVNDLTKKLKDSRTEKAAADNA